MAKEEKISVDAKRLPSISVKTVGYAPKELRKLVESDTGLHFIGRVGGIVAESFSGTNKSGEWHGFKGIFALKNRDSAQFTSTVLFLPSNLTKKVLAQLEQGEVEVRVVADIYVTENTKSGVGYAFQCEPVLGDEAVRKAEAISESIFSAKTPKLLSAPSKKSAA